MTMVDLDQVKQRLAIARAALERTQRLVAGGHMSVATADEALALMAELELQRVEEERTTAEPKVRRAARRARPPAPVSAGADKHRQDVSAHAS
jgi:hypothetical protein